MQLNKQVENTDTQKVEAFQGELLIQEPLASYTSWHVGGKAKQFYKPLNVTDLGAFLHSLPPEEPILWLGLGSNVLIRDGGFPGTVIYTQGKIQQLEMLDDVTVRAEAGVTCAKLAKMCARHSLDGGAFFAGIPGTVGGALAMNAGAFGGVTWDHVIAVETIDRQGVIRRREPSDFRVHYREVERLQGEWFVAGYFRFEKGQGNSANLAIKDLLRKRAETQPIGEFSCGSVFRNPPQNHAARLIESSGLKGKKIGGAWVSQKHANFIINGGDASAKDIENLITTVKEVVAKDHAIQLIPECHIIGDY